MESNIRRSWSHALLLKEADLRSLTQFLSSQYEKLDLTAKCVDGSQFTTGSIDELLQLENPSFRRIESIEAVAGEPWKKGASITIGGGFFATCKVAIKETDDAKALKIADEIEKRFRSYRASYSWFARISGATAVVMILIGSCSLFYWYMALSTGKLERGNIGIVGLISGIYMLLPLVLLLFWLLITFVDKTWEWLLPRVMIATGRQLEEHERRERHRNCIFWGVGATIVFGVIGSVIGNLITPIFTGR